MLSRFALHHQAAFAASTRPLTKTSAATPLYTTPGHPFSAARQPLLQTKNSMSITQQRVGSTNWVGSQPFTSIAASNGASQTKKLLLRGVQGPLLCLGLGGSCYLHKNKSNFQEWTVSVRHVLSFMSMSDDAVETLPPLECPERDSAGPVSDDVLVVSADSAYKLLTRVSNLLATAYIC